MEKRARCSYCVMQAKIQTTGSIWNGILPVTVYGTVWKTYKLQKILKLFLIGFGAFCNMSFDIKITRNHR